MSKSKTRGVSLSTYHGGIMYLPYQIYLTQIGYNTHVGLVEAVGSTVEKQTIQVNDIMYDDSVQPEIMFALGANCQPVAYHGKQYNNVAHTTLRGNITGGRCQYRHGDDENITLDGSTSGSTLRHDYSWGNVRQTYSISREARGVAGLVIITVKQHEWTERETRGYEWYRTEYLAYQRPSSIAFGNYVMSYDMTGYGRNISPFATSITSYQASTEAEADAGALDNFLRLEREHPVVKKERMYRTDLTGQVCTFIPSSLGLEQLVTLCNQNIVDPEPMWKRISNSGKTWTGLMFDLLQNIGMSSSNGLAYVKDSAEMRDSVLSTRDSMLSLVKALKQAKAGKNVIMKAVGTVASLYLSSHYGYRLQYQDTKEYLEQLGTLGSNVSRHARSSSSFSGITEDSWSFIQRCHLIFDNMVEEEQYLSEFLKQLDLSPSLENGWDMVPYSFTIDWFTNFGNILNAIDNMYHVQSAYKTVCTMDSIDASRIVDVARMTKGECTGGLVQTYYGRRVLPGVGHLPIPDSGSSPSSKFNHYLEAGSLIVQRIP